MAIDPNCFLSSLKSHFMLGWNFDESKVLFEKWNNSILKPERKAEEIRLWEFFLSFYFSFLPILQFLQKRYIVNWKWEQKTKLDYVM